MPDDRQETTTELPKTSFQGLPIEAPSALQVIEKAQVDQQITTAHAYPRDVARVTKRATELATIDEEVARGCFYSMPRRDGATGQNRAIEGPSVRLAEIIASSWGNLRVSTRLVGEDARFVTAQSVAHDLETNVAIAVEVKRRITNKSGRRYNDDMIGVTANAAASIAMRNAVFKVVPHAITQVIYRKARECAIGDAKTLKDRRASMLQRFRQLSPHITTEHVCAAVGKRSVDEIGLDDMATLFGVYNAIRDGDTTVEDAFPDPAAETKDETPAARIAAEAKRRREQDAKNAAESETEPATPADPKKSAGETKPKGD